MRYTRSPGSLAAEIASTCYEAESSDMAAVGGSGDGDGGGGGKAMLCHRLVLAAASPFLRTLLEGVEKEEEAVLVIPDYSARQISTALRMIYMRRVDGDDVDKGVVSLLDLLRIAKSDPSDPGGRRARQDLERFEDPLKLEAVETKIEVSDVSDDDEAFYFGELVGTMEPPVMPRRRKKRGRPPKADGQPEGRKGRGESRCGWQSDEQDRSCSSDDEPTVEVLVGAPEEEEPECRKKKRGRPRKAESKQRDEWRPDGSDDEDEWEPVSRSKRGKQAGVTNHGQDVENEDPEEKPKGRKVLTCWYCQKDGLSVAGLTDHVFKAHRDRYEEFCSTFKDTRSKYPQKCSRCDLVLRCLAEKRDHKKAHRGSVGRPKHLICDTCGFMAASKEEKKEHDQRNCKKRYLACEVEACNEILTNYRHLKDHLLFVHKIGKLIIS